MDHFTVTGITDPVTAGTTTSPVVTARDEFGNVFDTYVGTITFTSSDAQADLPSNYTFVGGDAGTHTFTDEVTLKTAGEQSVTVTDVPGGETGSQTGITVTDTGVLDHFTVTGITDPVTAGTTTSPVVTARDEFGNVFDTYVGTITFTSSDAQADLPSNYTFVGGDAGTHTFTDEVTLKTAGEQSVTVTDVPGGETGSQTGITVTDTGVLDHFTVTGIPDPQSAGTLSSPVVTARDEYGNIFDTYTGTIQFTSSDVQADLPSNYTFVGGDSGQHTFTDEVTLKTAGEQCVTVTDVPGGETGSQTGITVTDAGVLDHFTVTGIPDPQSAGTLSSPVVTAYDQYNNVKTDYTGTIHFTSSDAQADLPSNYTFVTGDYGTHTFTDDVVLKTVGVQSVTVTDVPGGQTGSQTGIDVGPGALGSFTVDQIADPQTAGDLTSPRVTALDIYGNTKTDYTGTVTFTSSDSGASTVLPSDYTFVGGDSGIHTFTNELQLTTTGVQWVRATDTVGGETGVQTGIDVNPAALGSFTVDQITDPQAAGTLSSPRVTALDIYGNTKTDYTGTVTFTSSDGGASTVLPSDYTFVGGDSGVHTFTNELQLTTTGEQWVRATDTVGGETGAQTGITVTPQTALDHFTVTNIPDPQTAGLLSTPIVTAYDQYNNVLTDYTGTIHFTSSDAIAVLPADYTFVAGDNGTHVFPDGVQMRTAGEQSVTVTDTVGGQTGSQTAITVVPALLEYFTVTSITDPQTAGSLSSPVVTAYDQFGNVKTNYTGTIHFTSSDVQAVLPADYTFLIGEGGTHTFTNGVQLKTTGEHSVSVDDLGRIGAQTGITVNPAAINYFTVTGITDPQAAGTLSSPIVTAYDQYDNIKTDYTGTVTFTSSDGGASTVLPSDYTFVVGDNGAHTFTNELQLTTTGVQWVRATDTVGGETGVQTGIDVNPAALGSFTVDQIADPQVAGTLTSPRVTALDIYGNTKTDYTGTVTFTSSDGGASTVLPNNYTFVGGDSGIHTFTNELQLTTTGVQWVRATDTVGGETGAQTGIDVNPAAFASFTVDQISDPQTAGDLTSPRVRALDTYGNTKTDYTGTVTFTSSDGGASTVLPNNYTFVGGDSGVHTFTNELQLTTTGVQWVRTTDTVGGETGVQIGIDVNPAALASFTVDQITDPQVAGTLTSPRVTALDIYGNTKTDFTGTVTFTSSDGGASTVLPGNYTFVGGDSGVHTFTNELQLTTTGVQWVRATDTVGGETGVQTGIDVNPAALGSFTVDQIADPQVAGTLTSPRVTALDIYGNTKTDYTGTVTFTSSDGGASTVLPGNYTFVGGDSGVHTFTNELQLTTTGVQWVRATDTVGGETGVQTGIDVNPAALGSFTVDQIADPQVAGTLTSPRVTALDIYGNTKTDYTGTVTFTSSDGGASTVLPGNYTFVGGDSGVHTFTNELQLTTTGTQWVRATDTVGGETGVQTGIDVNPAALGSFTVDQIADPQVAGTLTSPRVTALDIYGNTKTDYTGTVTFTSSDGGASTVLPSDYTFVVGDSGVHTFTNELQLTTTGTQWVRATDTVGGETGVQTGIDVNPAALGSFTVDQIADPQVAGTLTSPRVTALDIYGNTKTDYTGTVTFASSDGGASTVLPSNYTFVGGDSGVHTFTNELQLTTTGVQWVRATDTVGGETGVQTGIDVNPAALGSFTVDQITDPQVAGTLTSPRVTALDIYGNTKTDYTGTVTFTSSDVGASTVLPTDYAFVAGDNGVHTFTNELQLTTVGTQWVRATDTVGGQTGVQTGIDVNPAALGSFRVDQITDPQVAGTLTSPRVTALDIYGNTKTDYTGTVTFTSSDVGASTVLPTDYAFVAGDNGVHTFTNELQLTTVGTQWVRATDTVGGETGAQTGIDVTSTTIGYLAITGSATMTAGTSQELTITAYDTFGNVDVTYTGVKSVTFTGLNPAPDGTAPNLEGAVFGTAANVTFTAGIATGGAATLTAYRAETGTVHADDGTINSLGHELTVTVDPGTAADCTFTQQPTDTPQNNNIAPAVALLLRDTWWNNCVNDNTTVVAMAIGTNPGGGTLSGTLNQTAGAGAATFNDLNIDQIGTGYTLVASVGIVPFGTSATFNITRGQDDDDGDGEYGDIDRASRIIYEGVNISYVIPSAEYIALGDEMLDIICMEELYGFDLKLVDQNLEKKYMKRYIKGKYRTKVKVHKGKVVVAIPYDDEGPQYDLGVNLMEGQEIWLESIDDRR